MVTKMAANKNSNIDEFSRVKTFVRDCLDAPSSLSVFLRL